MWYEYEPLLTSNRLRSSTPTRVTTRLGPVNNILARCISGSQVSRAFLSEIFYEQPLQSCCLSQVGWLNNWYIKKYSTSVDTSTTPEITAELSRAPQKNNNKKLQLWRLSIFSLHCPLWILIFFQLCDLPSWTEWLWLFVSGSWLQNWVGKTKWTNLLLSGWWLIAL